MLEELAAKLLVSIDRLYFQWLDKGFEALAERYNGRSFLNGRVVGISSIDGTVVDEGEVLHVDERGRLVLLGDDGTKRAIVSGEAHVVL